MKARSVKELEKQVTQQIRQAADQQFEQFLDLARKLDKGGLYEFMYKHKLDIHHAKEMLAFDSITVTMQMALEGNDAAVDLLLKDFEAKPEHAAEGYARVNRQEKVEQLLGLHDVRDAACRGYARNGNQERVDNLLNRGANINMALFGAGRGGHDALIIHLLAHKKAEQYSVLAAIEGCAQSGNVELTNKLILREALLDNPETHHKLHNLFKKKSTHFSRACHAALNGYASAQLLNDEDSLLSLLTRTQDAGIRKSLTDFLTDKDVRFSLECRGISIQELCKTADILRKIMNDKKVDYDAALAMWKEELASVMDAAKPAAEPAAAPADAQPVAAQPVVAAEAPAAADAPAPTSSAPVAAPATTTAPAAETANAPAAVKPEPAAAPVAAPAAPAAPEKTIPARSHWWNVRFHKPKAAPTAEATPAVQPEATPATAPTPK